MRMTPPHNCGRWPGMPWDRHDRGRSTAQPSSADNTCMKGKSQSTGAAVASSSLLPCRGRSHPLVRLCKHTNTPPHAQDCPRKERPWSLHRTVSSEFLGLQKGAPTSYHLFQVLDCGLLREGTVSPKRPPTVCPPRILHPASRQEKRISVSRGRQATLATQLVTRGSAPTPRAWGLVDAVWGCGAQNSATLKEETQPTARACFP